MKTALITGASGGIGKEFAKIFAKNGYNLVLTARGNYTLDKIADALKTEYDVHISTFSADLSQPGSADNLYSKIMEQKIQIDILINNAGFGDYGYFLESELDRTSDMIHLNIVTLTELTLLFAKEMKKRNTGKILNIASTAAFQPIPKFAVYAATKSFVLNFTEALHYELRKTNISVSALCPGPTATGFKDTANMKNSKLFKNGVMLPNDVAKAGYKGLMKNKMTIVSGFKNKIMTLLSSATPSRKLLVWVSAKMS